MEKEVQTRDGAAVTIPTEAIGRFIRACRLLNHLTSMFGDVPQAEALDASVTSTPTYTLQEQVFAYVLNELDSANTDLTSLIANNDNSLSASPGYLLYKRQCLTKGAKIGEFL